MTTSDNIAAISKALESVKHSEWFMSPWHVEEDASAVRNNSDGSYICNASSDRFATYIAACNPVAVSILLVETRKAEAMTREIAEKDARIAALEEALKPFAEVEPMDVYETEDEDANGCYVLTQNHFRRARTLLNGGSDAQPV